MKTLPRARFDEPPVCAENRKRTCSHCGTCNVTIKNHGVVQFCFVEKSKINVLGRNVSERHTQFQVNIILDARGSFFGSI